MIFLPLAEKRRAASIQARNPMEQSQQFPSSNQAQPAALAIGKRAPDLAPVGGGRGIHHADGCGVEQLQGGEVTA